MDCADSAAPPSRRLAAYLEAEPDRQAAASKATQAKLDELNAEIARLDAVSSGAGGKRRLDDNAYVEQSRALVEGVKDAVKEAMLAKRKKAKLAAAAKENGAGEVPVVKAQVPVVEGLVKLAHGGEGGEGEAAAEAEAEVAGEGAEAEDESAGTEVVATKPKSKGRGRK